MGPLQVNQLLPGTIESVNVTPIAFDAPEALQTEPTTVKAPVNTPPP